MNVIPDVHSEPLNLWLVAIACFYTICCLLEDCGSVGCAIPLQAVVDYSWILPVWVLFSRLHKLSSFNLFLLAICPRLKTVMVHSTKPSTAFRRCILHHHPLCWWRYWIVSASLSTIWALCWLLSWPWDIDYCLFSLVAQTIFSSLGVHLFSPFFSFQTGRIQASMHNSVSTSAVLSLQDGMRLSKHRIIKKIGGWKKILIENELKIVLSMILLMATLTSKVISDSLGTCPTEIWICLIIPGMKIAISIACTFVRHFHEVFVFFIRTY